MSKAFVPPTATLSRGTDMRDLSSLTREEALTVVAKIMAIAYLDDSDGDQSLNPDREMAGADVVADLVSVLAEHGLHPETVCSVEMLGPHLAT
jgi:hypothetical protein